MGYFKVWSFYFLMKYKDHHYQKIVGQIWETNLKFAKEAYRGEFHNGELCTYFTSLDPSLYSSNGSSSAWGLVDRGGPGFESRQRRDYYSSKWVVFCVVYVTLDAVYKVNPLFVLLLIRRTKIINQLCLQTAVYIHIWQSCTLKETSLESFCS